MSRRYVARYAESAKDIAAAQALRAKVFRAGQPDYDRFDNRYIHVLVEDTQAPEVVCTFRIMPFSSGQEIDTSYAAQYYELSGLKGFKGKLVEMGRFCVSPAQKDPDILRAAWGMMTRYVDENNVKMLFGCSSFKGAEATAHLEAFALLKARHIAPRKWLPKIKSPKVFRFSRSSKRPNLHTASSTMPPLLRTYLAMGGWTSDHAVVDNDLDSLHVFTGLEIGVIPESRKRLLRAVVG